jgi:hypothetical protein
MYQERQFKDLKSRTSIVSDEKEQSPCVAVASMPTLADSATTMRITHIACGDRFNARDKAVETGGSKTKTQGP